MVTDDIIERQIIAAAQRDANNEHVADPMMLAAARILNAEFNPRNKIEGCSNGAARFSIHFPPRSVNRE